MTTIIDVLKEEHRNIETLLLILEQELHVFMKGERPDFDILRSFITYFLDYPDQCHHPKEDLIFSILRKRNASMSKSIDEVMSEHENEYGCGDKVLQKAIIYRLRAELECCK